MAVHVCRGRTVWVKSRDMEAAAAETGQAQPCRALEAEGHKYLPPVVPAHSRTINYTATFLTGHHVKGFVLRTTTIPGRPDHHSLPPSLQACCSARPGARACQPERPPWLFELDDVRRALLGSPWPSGPPLLLPGRPCSPHANFPLFNIWR